MTINDPRDDPKYQVGGQNYKGEFEQIGTGVWDSKTVKTVHNKSDVDSGANAQHHTLGNKQDQSAPGNHKHDGTDSLRLLTGFNITGTRGTSTAVPSIIAALVQLGATDSTTA